MKAGSKERIRQIALRFLSEDSYALQDDYSDEQIADLVTSVVLHFKIHSTSCVRTMGDGELLIKVNNAFDGSSVSISKCEKTVVARSLAYIIQLQEEVNEDEIKELLGMLDEAYFSLMDYIG